MTDGNITTGQQSIMVIVGVALVALAIGGGGWYGWHVASSATAPQGMAREGDVPGLSANATPASGPLPNSSGIGKGETIISKSFYTRPPAVFDAITAMQLAASEPVPGASAAGAVPAKASVATATGSTAGSTAPKEVFPAGWAGAGASVEKMWESNAAAAWNIRPTPLTPPNWRISGVVQRGEQTQIMIQFDGEPETRFFKVGDVLPGGGKLTWVKPNVIGVSFPKKKPLSVPLVEDPFQPASSASSPTAAPKARP